MFNDPNATIPDSHDVYSFPEGPYFLFNLVRFVEDHSEASGLLDPDSHSGGQELRTALEGLSCSGVMYPSVRDGGGINASVWPLDGTPLASGDLFRPYSGPR